MAVKYLVHKYDETSPIQTAGCFGNLRTRQKGITGVTYFPGQIVTDPEIEEFKVRMNSFGFEFGPVKDGEGNRIYHINTTEPRELFNYRVPHGWILANLILSRYIHDQGPILRDFLHLCHTFPHEDDWFLFYIAHVLSPVGYGHRLIERGRFCHWEEVLEAWHKEITWDTSNTTYPNVAPIFSPPSQESADVVNKYGLGVDDMDKVIKVMDKLRR